MQMFLQSGVQQIQQAINYTSRNMNFIAIWWLLLFKSNDKLSFKATTGSCGQFLRGNQIQRRLLIKWRSIEFDRIESTVGVEREFNTEATDIQDKTCIMFLSTFNLSNYRLNQLYDTRGSTIDHNKYNREILGKNKLNILYLT